MKLGEIGVRIAIDDFATGYSTLNSLVRFPINTLKIDRGFVADITNDEGSAAIVSTVLSLARNLGLNAIAEGVETEKQLDFLRERSCAQSQGYLFSVPAKDIPRLIQERETPDSKKQLGLDGRSMGSCEITEGATHLVPAAPVVYYEVIEPVPSSLR